MAEGALAAGIGSRLDVEVRAPGRRAVYREDVQDDQAIRLEPGIGVRVTLPPGRRGSEAAPLHATASVLRDESKRYFRFQTDLVHAAVKDADEDAVRLLLPESGRWLVTLASVEAGTEPATITIDVRGDAEAEQVFAFE